MTTPSRDEAAEKMAPILKEAFENLQRPYYLDLWRVTALERRVKFQAHIAAGFTEAQALELCKA